MFGQTRRIATSIAGSAGGLEAVSRPAGVHRGCRRDDVGERTGDMIIAALATIYAVFLVFAADVGFLMLGILVYAPGTILYYMTRREQQKPLVTPGGDGVGHRVGDRAIAAVVGLEPA